MRALKEKNLQFYEMSKGTSQIPQLSQDNKPKRSALVEKLLGKRLNMEPSTLKIPAEWQGEKKKEEVKPLTITKPVPFIFNTAKRTQEEEKPAKEFVPLWKEIKENF
jgi:hypothetical protein